MSVKDRFPDAFVKVSFQEDMEGDPMFGPWRELGSQKHQGTVVSMTSYLQKQYPNHSIVLSDGYTDILGLPGILVQPLSPTELITNTRFISLPRNASRVPGTLGQIIEYGGFRLAWKNFDFILYIALYPRGFGVYQQYFILHEGPKQPSHELLLSAGVWQNELHNQIWVFNQGTWLKDHELWSEIQKAEWDDVILEDDFKGGLKKDVYGFFESETLYKKYQLPWKRGIIMHGPPGNGKTICIKAIMKDCDALGFVPLYVKSFKSWMGEEGSIQAVFKHARRNSPCVVILEDLDSLINDANRSFFLNELDGLSGNNGLLVIGTTNHFDRLDPGLSTRPSRFDRKYFFDDPNRDARLLYVQYWQNKLSGNDAISFPESLANEIADKTDRFSFAYLKEVFVSSLMTTLKEHEAGHDVSFAECIRSEIDELRKQLDKPNLMADLDCRPSTSNMAKQSSVALPGMQNLLLPETDNSTFSSLLGKLISELSSMRSVDPLIPVNMQDADDLSGRPIDTSM